MPCVFLTLGKLFAVCPINGTRQRSYLPMPICRVSFAVCNTRQRVCRGYFGLCRVPKGPVSRSDYVFGNHGLLAPGRPIHLTLHRCNATLNNDICNIERKYLQHKKNTICNIKKILKKVIIHLLMMRKKSAATSASCCMEHLNLLLKT